MATTGGSGGGFPIPSSVIDIQRRLLELQRSAFTNAFEMAARLQDQRRDLLERWIDRVPNLPAEGKALLETWTDAQERGRETFRATVDKSFDLVEGYYDRLAERGRSTESST